MESFLLLTQNYDTVVVRRLFVQLVVYIDRSVEVDVFYERQLHKAGIHETKGIFVDFYFR